MRLLLLCSKSFSWTVAISNIVHTSQCVQAPVSFLGTKELHDQNTSTKEDVHNIQDMPIIIYNMMILFLSLSIYNISSAHNTESHSQASEKTNLTLVLGPYCHGSGTQTQWNPHSLQVQGGKEQSQTQVASVSTSFIPISLDYFC